MNLLLNSYCHNLYVKTTKTKIMDITLEWEGIAGVIKILLLFSVPLIIGFIIGRKTKK